MIIPITNAIFTVIEGVYPYGYSLITITYYPVPSGYIDYWYPY